MAFQEKDGFDVAFFMMFTYECMFKDGREYEQFFLLSRDDEVCISLLDSVKYFQPKELRTQVYQKIIIGYLQYAADIG